MCDVTLRSNLHWNVYEILVWGQKQSRFSTFEHVLFSTDSVETTNVKKMNQVWYIIVYGQIVQSYTYDAEAPTIYRN